MTTEATAIVITGSRPNITPPILMAASETLAMTRMLKKMPR